MTGRMALAGTPLQTLGLMIQSSCALSKRPLWQNIAELLGKSSSVLMMAVR